MLTLEVLDNQQTRSQALSQLPHQVIVFTILDLPPSSYTVFTPFGAISECGDFAL